MIITNYKLLRLDRDISIDFTTKVITVHTHITLQCLWDFTISLWDDTFGNYRYPYPISYNFGGDVGMNNDWSIDPVSYINLTDGYLINNGNLIHLGVRLIPAYFLCSHTFI